jgi:hypothetical protein
MAKPEFTVRIDHPRRVRPWVKVFRSGVLVFQHETTRELAQAQVTQLRERLDDIARTDRPMTLCRDILGE